MTGLSGLGIAPGPVLRVFGLRRSGNHAVINWLARNAPDGRSVFFNNCTPGRNPFETFRAVEVNGRRAGGPGDDAAGLARRAGDGTAVIFSYEDAMPNERRRRPVTEGVADSAIAADIVVCRSFHNWAASLVRKLQGNPAHTAAQRVAIVLKAVGLYARMLDLVAAEAAPGIVTVRYDEWMASPGYRAGLLDRLGFAQRDDSLGAVQRYGNGSSFADGARSGEELRTAERWREMADDPEYRMVLWLAAQDAALRCKLAAVFPREAERLGAWAGEAADAALPEIAGSEHRPARDGAPAHIFRRN